MNDTSTNRGFDLSEFLDTYGNKCSIQNSSAMEPKIWLGVNDANPIILASDAKKLKLKVSEKTGWVRYPVPKEVLMHTRMHLNVDQVKAILPYLERFVETGSIL